jgi:hypothetical protein
MISIDAAYILPENLVVWSFTVLAGVSRTYQRLTPRQYGLSQSFAYCMDALKLA